MVSNTEMYDKARKVIESCNTKDQLLVAREYFHLCKFQGDGSFDYASALLDLWYKKEKSLDINFQLGLI